MRAELAQRKNAEYEKIVLLFAKTQGTAEDLWADDLQDVTKQLGVVLNERQLLAATRELGLDSGPVKLPAFCAWWASRGLGVGGEHEHTTANVWRAFCMVDEDGGGSIDAAELAAACKKVGILLEGDKVMETMLQIDKDGSGEVEFEEFADWLLPILLNEGGKEKLGTSLGVSLGMLLTDSGDLFHEIDSESSEEEEDKIGAAEEMFNDLLAQSFGGSKEMFGLSLGMFPPDHYVRVAISKVVFHPMCEICILGCIFTNLVALLFQNPGDEQVALVSIINTVCGVIFTVEMCCRIVVHGFWGNEAAYLRNGWNVRLQLYQFVSQRATEY